MNSIIKCISTKKILGYYNDKPPEINMWPSLLSRAVQKIKELDSEVNALRKEINEIHG